MGALSIARAPSRGALYQWDIFGKIPAGCHSGLNSHAGRGRGIGGALAGWQILQGHLLDPAGDLGTQFHADAGGGCLRDMR